MSWSYIDESELVLAGWLVKEGEIHKTWHKRWFRNTLEDLKTLKYYADYSCNEKQLKGTIDLSACTSWKCFKGKEPGDKMSTGISLETPGRIWRLVAEGATNTDYWVRGLRHLMEFIEEQQSAKSPLAKGHAKHESSKEPEKEVKVEKTESKKEPEPGTKDWITLTAAVRETQDIVSGKKEHHSSHHKHHDSKKTSSKKKPEDAEKKEQKKEEEELPTNTSELKKEDAKEIKKEEPKKEEPKKEEPKKEEPKKEEPKKEEPKKAEPVTAIEDPLKVAEPKVEKKEEPKKEEPKKEEPKKEEPKKEEPKKEEPVEEKKEEPKKEEAKKDDVVDLTSTASSL